MGLKMVTEAITIEPENAMYFDTLGCLLQATGKDTDALKAFEQALVFRKKDSEVTWSILASVYSRLGKEKDASDARLKA